jgi:hypothetical protein
VSEYGNILYSSHRQGHLYSGHHQSGDRSVNLLFLPLPARFTVGYQVNEVRRTSALLQIPLLYLDGILAFRNGTRRSGNRILWLARIELELMVEDEAVLQILKEASISSY